MNLQQDPQQDAPPLDSKFAGEIAEIVGRGNVLRDPVSLMTYETDGVTLYKAAPSVVAFPADAEQVSALVQLANRRRVPFIARGAGTGLSGGAIAAEGGLIIAMNKMNRVLEIDIENRRAVVEPGVVNLWITQAAEPRGYHYAPDPSSQKACTIGGNVAENSGGPHTLKRGVTSNHVTGLEWVMPDGEIVQFGNKTDDCVGYDLRGLVIGSEGTLGIATKIVVKLTPNPQTHKTLLAVFAGMRDASQAVSDTIASGMIPASLEMMDKLIIGAVEEAFQFGFPKDAEAALLIELDGLEAGMQEQADRIARICERNRAASVQVAQSEAERQLLWKSRKQAFGSLGRIAKDYLTQDGVVPRTKLPDTLDEVQRVSRKYGIPIANVFHAGDGNIHPILLFDQDDPEQVQKVLEASGEIMKACVDAGGTITGEHGIGVEKMDFMRLIFSEDDLRLMRGLRDLFDPRGLCNPGKIFPEDGPSKWGIRL